MPKRGGLGQFANLRGGGGGGLNKIGGVLSGIDTLMHTMRTKGIFQQEGYDIACRYSVFKGKPRFSKTCLFYCLLQM